LKQFEDCAARCFEFARSATTTAGRAHFVQMAREYESAALLIHKELSAELRSPLANAPAVRRDAEDSGR